MNTLKNKTLKTIKNLAFVFFVASVFTACSDDDPEVVNQEELINLMRKNSFKKCTYINLSGGIVSIHSGWKI